MATVQIYLEPDESEDAAIEALRKALDAQSGETHEEDFHQGAAREVVQTLNRKHDQMWSAMLKEIFQVLDQEV